MHLHPLLWLLLFAQFADVQTSKILEGRFVSLFEFQKKAKNSKKSRVFLPEMLTEVYQKLLAFKEPVKVDPKRNSFGANTIRIFGAIESLLDGLNMFRYEFNVGVDPKSVLRGSELILLGENFTRRITVGDITHNSTDKEECITNILDTKDFGVVAHDVINLDVEAAVRRWIKPNGFVNQALMVTFTETPKKSVTPLLLIYLTQDDPTKKREIKRRHTTDKVCRRRKMYVDFEELDWNDWIIAPSGYHAYFCGGECHFPFTQRMNVTNHAIVQGITHLFNPEDVPEPCCVPTKLNSISLLTIEGDGVVIKEYKDMVVASCGCR